MACALWTCLCCCILTLTMKDQRKGRYHRPLAASPLEPAGPLLGTGPGWGRIPEQVLGSAEVGVESLLAVEGAGEKPRLPWNVAQLHCEASETRRSMSLAPALLHTSCSRFKNLGNRTQLGYRGRGGLEAAAPARQLLLDGTQDLLPGPKQPVPTPPASAWDLFPRVFLAGKRASPAAMSQPLLQTPELFPSTESCLRAHDVLSLHSS